MTTTAAVYTDDPDAAWSWQVTDDNGNTLDFAPLVAIGAGDYDITATWQGTTETVGTTTKRWLKVPLTGLTASTSPYPVYLRVPGGIDFKLGTVYIRDRH